MQKIGNYFAYIIQRNLHTKIIFIFVEKIFFFAIYKSSRTGFELVNVYTILTKYSQNVAKSVYRYR